MATLGIILVYILSIGLPLAVIVGVPTFIVIRVVRFGKSQASRGRKVLVVAGAVVAVPVLLIACLLLTQAIQTASLKWLGRAVGVEENKVSRSVEPPVAR